MMVLDYTCLKDEELVNMYGVTFDLNVHVLEDEYKISRSSAYTIISQELERLGFRHLQYSVYICAKYKNEMLLVYHIVEALKKYEWFKASVHNMIAFKLDTWSEITEAFKE